MRLHRLLPLLLLAACEGDPSGIDGVRLAAVVDESAPPPEANVVLQVRNVADHAVWVWDEDCGDDLVPVVDRREGDQWVALVAPGLCFGAMPVLLQPGELAEAGLAIHQPGRYRMRVRVAAEGGGPTRTPAREFTIGS